MRLHSVKCIAISLTAVASVWSSNAYAQNKQTSYKFDFGSGKPKAGFMQVVASKVYTDSYGFDLGTSAQSVSRTGKTSGFITSDKPFYFSVAVPEGNYKVTLTLGDPQGTSQTMVKAESRRLMLESTDTKSGEIKKVSFVVNVRMPEISTGGRVKLKPREVGKLDWDDRLTLEFTGAKPCIDAMEIEKVDDQITVYLAGNSTVVDQDDEPWAAWLAMATPGLKKRGIICPQAAQGSSSWSTTVELPAK